MQYNEKHTAFIYKVADAESGKSAYRITVDMGLHQYLKFTERDVLMWLEISSATKYIYKEAKEQLLYNIGKVKELLKDYKDTVNILEERFLPTNPKAFVSRELLKQANSRDEKTTYNLKYWETIEAEIVKIPLCME